MKGMITGILLTIAAIGGLVMNTIYAQVEEQEGNAEGKMAKFKDVFDTCQEKVKQGSVVWDSVKDDCFKVISEFNTNMSQILRNNKDSIDKILYG